MVVSFGVLDRRCRIWGRRRSIVAVMVMMLMMTLVCTHTWGLWGEPGEQGKPSCLVSEEQRQALFPLVAAVSKLLTTLSITHFLCFDSLWGAVQESGPLPWDRNAHLCALNEHVSRHEEAELLRAFRRHGLTLMYSSAEGQYTVYNASTPTTLEVPRVHVVLFEEDERVQMIRRVGWKRRLLPPDCDAHPSLQCFPPALAATPLPSRSFGPLSLPAPHENIDLLKFHYPETWWRPLQPHC